MLRIAIAAAVLTCAAPALAQNMTAAQREACKGDYDKYCKGTMPGGGRIIGCLEKQRASLAEACRKVLDAQKK
ncbi:MAG: hypothetical protein JOZ70_08995 [Pseudolabrys sp.]|nr:hypothetical protein [Pseudolabrys sp.]